MAWKASTPDRVVRALSWENRRRQLGLTGGGREWDLRQVATRLGISVRTVLRYEFGKAPRWYDYALVGLWQEDRRRDAEKKAG